MAVTVKSTPSDEAIELDIKRLYLPGVVLSAKCPKCGKKAKSDLGKDYLSYPSANVPIDHTMYCGKCDDGWTEEIILRVGVEPVVKEPA